MPPIRVFILVDEDVNPEDPLEVLWAIGTRFDPITGVRVSVTQSAWLLDPMRTTDQQAGHAAQPYKRLIINGCRRFDRLKDFPTVNKLSDSRRGILFAPARGLILASWNLTTECQQPWFTTVMDFGALHLEVVVYHSGMPCSVSRQSPGKGKRHFRIMHFPRRTNFATHLRY